MGSRVPTPPAFPGTLLSRRRSAPDFDFSALNCTTHLTLRIVPLPSTLSIYILHSSQCQQSLPKSSLPSHKNSLARFLTEVALERVRKRGFTVPGTRFFCPAAREEV